MEDNNKQQKKMPSNDIYFVRENKLEHFICTFTEDNKSNMSNFENIEKISDSAFKNVGESLEIVCVNDKLNEIGKSAFENCNELWYFFCGKIDFNSKLEIEKSSISHITQNEGFCGDFTIQTNAFKNCSKLTTVILPKMSQLVIEKNAFAGCENLRTVVADCEKIDFTENPFEDCSSDLTFICKKGSDVARFARENGYRGIYVD